jgi:uncharacterized protein YjgD (DUF1641 family)
MSLSTHSNGSVAEAEAQAAAAATQMLMRLGEPQVVDAITKLVDRLDVVVMLVDSLDGFVKRSETILESVMQSASEARATVESAPGVSEVDVPATLAATASLAGALPDMAPALTSPGMQKTLELLSDEALADSLARLASHSEILVMLVEALDGMIQRSETIIDSVIKSSGELRTTIAGTTSEVDLGQAIAAAQQVASVLPEMTPALVRGAKSGAIDELTSPALVNMLHLVSSGTRDALDDPQPVRVSSALSLMRALKDPDVARSISFFATLGRAVGRALDPNTK